MKEKYFIAYSNVVNITIKSKAILNALRYVTTMFFCLFTCIFLTDQTFICQNTIFVFSCLHLQMYASCFQKNPCSMWLHIFVGDSINANYSILTLLLMPKKAFDREMKSESGFSFAMASQPFALRDGVKKKSTFFKKKS